MKLLTPSEIQDTRAQQMARDAMRSKELNKSADEARKNLANAQADFQTMLAGQQMRWAKEDADHTKEVSQRESELSILEERRKKALEPILLIEKRAQDTLYEAQNALQSVLKRESDADELQELLQEKLDAVGSREVDVNVREQKAQANEKNQALQQKIIDDNAVMIAKSTEALQKEKAKTYKELDRLRTALTLQERSLGAKDEQLKKEKQELIEWATRLKDERGALDRIYIRTVAKKKRV